MRRFALPLLVLSGCSFSDGPQPQLLDGLPAKPLLRCASVEPAAGDVPVRELGTTADGRLLVTLETGREVLLLNTRLEKEASFVFDPAGPRGVAIPLSAALIDSVLYVIDVQMPKIRRFTLDGAVLSDIELDFVPQRLVDVNGTLAVIPAVIGRYPSSLLYTMRRDTAISQGIAPFNDPNASIKMLGNLVAVAVLDDRLLLVNQYLTPRAYHWSATSGSRALEAPVAREFKKSIGYIPPIPLDESALEPVLAVALGAASHPGRDQFAVLVRSGAKIGERFEKAIVITDAELNYSHAVRLPMNAGHLAILRDSDRLVLVDEEGQWHTCPLP